MPNLTPRQQRFVDAAASSDSAAEAARMAGYSPRRASVTGSELMAKPHVRAAVELRRSEVLAQAGYDPVVVVARLIDLCMNAQRDRDAIRAAELLLKLGALFEPEEQHQHLYFPTLSVERLEQLEQTLLDRLADTGGATGEDDGGREHG